MTHLFAAPNYQEESQKKGGGTSKVLCCRLCLRRRALSTNWRGPWLNTRENSSSCAAPSTRRYVTCRQPPLLPLKTEDICISCYFWVKAPFTQDATRNSAQMFEAEMEHNVANGNVHTAYRPQDQREIPIVCKSALNWVPRGPNVGRPRGDQIQGIVSCIQQIYLK